ncbi:MAG: hypothetical protein CW691_02055 [Candidatus Bathyarchaeum sp.]|nr:MAG: hypothetical protein CW691_02055 [Candidatus Bathyarchaeum sp.]
MNDIQVNIEAQVNPTEEPEKVKHAIENVFGPVTFKLKPKTWGQLLTAQTTGTEGLTKLSNLIKRAQIITASRKVLRRSATDDSITFYLNKQVAYVGHISFSQQTAESPLGPIKVEIKCDNPRKLIDWIAPRSPKRK